VWGSLSPVLTRGPNNVICANVHRGAHEVMVVMFEAVVGCPKNLVEVVSRVGTLEIVSGCQGTDRLALSWSIFCVPLRCSVRWLLL
jgi:hypothetical protein